MFFRCSCYPAPHLHSFHSFLMDEVPAKNNLWFAISMGLIGVIVGYGLATGIPGSMHGGSVTDRPSPTADVPTPTPPPTGEVQPVDPKVDHIRGNPNAEISIIEYSEYQCPFCDRHHPTLKQVLDEYGDDVNWVFRHFPLSFHEHAQKASEASECAADQGGNNAFWEYHDLLFEKGLGEENYLAHAEELGLDADELKDCLDTGKFEQHVKDDFASGGKAGVRGTPGNVIYNNKTEEFEVISGALPFDSFKAVLDEML